ncbi:uncharacterized protein At5g08430 isoform X1 [Ziziphus jujuba]|uniref:Uncharacterized protein At5g08430 isoform X1 n=1 Tax=Ziziphus jujuba TaxID=326968 RepID=A0ABM4A6I0_ZIZJJ|nr:uncharacterized protein At5g08430 isoform X1 [Ziziphus jujuba var. spinosa]XP_060672340.1 uncharacterized protein At5g08430 isoform X1 [Ziziphus jujuba]
MEWEATAAFEWVEVGDDEEEEGFTITSTNVNGSSRPRRKRKRMMRMRTTLYNNNNNSNNKKKKIELVGWASRPLLHFLHSIGKDTSHKIPHHDVTSIVNDYVVRNNLLHPTRKKRVVCDQALLSLFGRKSIARVKIFDLLDPHLAENRLYDSSSDDGDDYEDAAYFELEEEEDDDEEDEKQQSKPPPPPRKSTTVERSCFAAVIPDNIRLVYLRRSLVEHLLLKQKHNHQEVEVEVEKEEQVVDKIVGSFVRTKSDPNDYLQKHSHILLQVTGLTINKASQTDCSTSQFLLQVSGMIKHIHVSMLSDDNFTEEECEDLRQRIKIGLLKKPTVDELQQKAQILHEDITKHWLMRELALLQNLIDRANEKGWRRELFECLERRKQLQTPDEQLRLLRELPKVTADELQLEAEPQFCAGEVKKSNNSSSRSIVREAPELPTYDTKTEECASIWTLGGIDFAGSQHNVNVQEDWQKQPTEFIDKSDGETQHLEVKENKASQQMVDEMVTRSRVIDLSDDDEIENPSSKNQIPDDQLGSLIWHYQDPLGNAQGPFAITSLKRWNDADYFPPDFKIWKTGQSSNEAVLLKDILNQAFFG